MVFLLRIRWPYLLIYIEKKDLDFHPYVVSSQV